MLPMMGNSELHTLGIVDAAGAKKTLFMILKNTILADLNDSAVELEELLTNETTRPKTLANRLDEYKKIRQKAEMFGELLRCEVTDIEERVSELEGKVKKGLEGSLYYLQIDNQQQ